MFKNSGQFLWNKKPKTAKEVSLHYKDNKVVIDPADFVQNVKSLRTLVLILPIVALIMDLSIFYMLSSFGSLDKSTVLSIGGSFLVSILVFIFIIFYALRWLFPRSFDIVSMKMTVQIPLFPLRYDIGEITTVRSESEIVDDPQRKSRKTIILRAVAEIPSRKKPIVILKLSDSLKNSIKINLEKSFRNTIDQLCRQMGWQYEGNDNITTKISNIKM